MSIYNQNTELCKNFIKLHQTKLHTINKQLENAFKNIDYNLIHISCYITNGKNEIKKEIAINSFKEIIKLEEYNLVLNLEEYFLKLFSEQNIEIIRYYF
jgi:hypothetical protein